MPMHVRHLIAEAREIDLDRLEQGPLRPLLLEAPQRPRRQQIVLLEKIDVSPDLGSGGDERESDQEAAISTSSLASRAL